jgi:3'-5' exoribonuclease
MEVREFAEGIEFAQPLLVRDAELRRRRDGGEFLRVRLGDRTAVLTAVLEGELLAAREHCRPGAVVHATGRVVVHPRFGPELELASLRPAEPGEYVRSELEDGPLRSAEQLESDLRDLIATVHNADLRRVLAAVFGPGTAVWASFRDAPAAKHYHQAYRHGLLEHALSVAQAVGAISATFPGIDRDLAVTGALLHDLGKLDAYASDEGSIEMTDLGRLYGEIPLGYYRLRRLIEELGGFPAELERALLHIILSHHGSLEHGSPVLPATREATLVHMIDNLGGRLGSFDRLEKALPPGEQWSRYDKGIGGGAYFGLRGEPERRAAA